MVSDDEPGPARIRRFGDDAVLAEVADTEAVLRLTDRLGRRPAGVIDVVPAARTVLVVFDAAQVSASAVAAWLLAAIDREADGAGRHAPSEVIEIPTRYDGLDLASAAARLGLDPVDLIAEHTRALWRVAFTGFAPGFGYLVSDDWPHRLPRLAEPRTRVPAGSVALADRYGGVYPRATPGGWQVIGTTDIVLFDVDRTPPALLTPGSRVRFIDVAGAHR